MRRIYQEKFQQIWQDFNRSTDVRLYNPERTQESHGRKNHLALAIKITDMGIRDKMLSTADRIRDIQGLYIFPPEYYHITVKILGFMSEMKNNADDIVPGELNDICHQVTSVIEQIPIFTLEIGSVNSLGSFIILEVEDEGNISMIQQTFREKTTLIPRYELEVDNWLPHISIAAFQSSGGLEELKIRLAELRGKRIGEMKVKRIDLIAAGLQKPFPKLRVVHSYQLNARHQ